jgi:hypothetical protein
LNVKKLLLPFALCLPIFLIACAQQIAHSGFAANTEPGAEQAGDGLQVRASGLDSVAAAFAFDLNSAKVYVAPLQIEYSKHSAGARSGLRAKDYELDAKDRTRLQELMAQTFSEKFLAPRNSQLVSEAQQADYTFQPRLEKFSLAAPLDPAPWLWRVYTDQSAYGVLAGDLYDREGNLVMRFSDRRDIGESFGGFASGNVERFTSVTFWADMKIDLRRAFFSLDKSLR